WLSRITWNLRWWWPLRRPRRSFRRVCGGCCGAARSTGWRGYSGPGTRSLRRPRRSARATSRPLPRPRARFPRLLARPSSRPLPRPRARLRTWPGRPGRPRRAPRTREPPRVTPV
ncbi:MAG: hypothetical protein AVDCRST_MAG03-2381, partial [uncultured Rubrobacteraceae bacterium]